MKDKMSLKTIVICALFAAIIGILSPMAIPIGPIPITLGTFAISLTGYVLGAKNGAIAVLIYILLGAIGLPVFSSYRGGLGVITGVTGGFIIAYPLFSLACGLQIFTKKCNGITKYIVSIIQGLLGLMVLYLVGMIQFSFVASAKMSYAFSVCVMPFIIKDIISIVIAFIIANTIKTALKKAKLL